MKRKATSGIALILSLIAALTFCGCSQGNENVPPADDTAAQTVSARESGEPTADTTEQSTSSSDEASQTVNGSESSYDRSEETVPTAEATDAKPEVTTSTTEPSNTTKPSVTTTKPPITTTKPSEATTTTTQKPVETTTTVPKPDITTTTTVITEPETPSPGVEKASLLWDYSKKWWYNHLNKKQQTAYSRLFNNMKNGINQCDISDLNLSFDEFSAFIFGFDKDNPQFLNTTGNFKCDYITAGGKDILQTAIVEESPIAPDYEKFKQKADSVLAEAKKRSSDYERLKYIHDYISENCKYTITGTPEASYEKRADGVLLEGKALCVGYSKAMMYFSQELGIPCICVEGIANEEHMWNMVQLEGSWYHLDMTWDDPVTSDGSNYTRYDYFLVSDSTIGKNHTLTGDYENPAAPKDYIN